MATIFALIIFSLAMIVIGIAQRPNSSADFHIKEREVNTLELSVATFTMLGGGEFITLTALAYLYGYWGILYFGGVAIGFVVFAFLAKRAREQATARDLHSLPDYFYVHFGRVASILATTFSCFALGALLLLQFVVGGLMIATVAGIPAWTCIVGLAFVVGVYVYLAGFHGVLATDKMQAFVMVAALIALTIGYALLPVPLQTENLQLHVMPGLGDSIPLILLGAFAVLGGGDVWQRVFSAESDKTVRKGLLINALGWIVFGMIFVWLALQIQMRFPQADPNNAFFDMLGSGLPDWLAAMVTLMLISAVISTADIEIFVLAVMLNKEVNRTTGHEMTRRATKFYVLGICIVSCALGLLFQDIVSIYFLLLYLLMIMGPIAFARLLGRGTPALAVSGLIGGLVVLLILVFTEKTTGAYQLLVIVPPLIAFLRKAEPDKSITT